MAGPSLLLYVQHLLGVGHLKRALTLAHGFVGAGYAVTVVSGGVPSPAIDTSGVAFVQLPPLRAADEHFKLLLDEHDEPIDDAWKARRRDMLLSVYERAIPDVLMLELFPFGRRQLRFELDDLLARTRVTSPRRRRFVLRREPSGRSMGWVRIMAMLELESKYVLKHAVVLVMRMI